MSKNENFLNLISKKDFLKKIVELQNKKEVIKAFENEGVTPTEEEMELLTNVLNKTCDELGKHSKEEIKEMKTMFDSLSEDQLLAVAGGGKSFLRRAYDYVRGNLSESAQAAADATIGGAQIVLDAATKGNELKGKQSDNQRIMHDSDNKVLRSNNAKQVAMACIGVAAVLTPMYMFKDEIKGWFRSKK